MPASAHGTSRPAPARGGGPPALSRYTAHSARLADLPHDTPRAPVAIAIPRLGVQARIVPAGVSSQDDLLELPANASTVAWYRYGPSPGQPGSAVLAAHVDYNGRPGVFFRLRELGPGDRVRVGFGRGPVREFVVVARRTYDKPQLPTQALFAGAGRPVVTLVTCGGRFDRHSRHYLSNVVVYAVPAPAPRPAVAPARPKSVLAAARPVRRSRATLRR